MLQPWGSRSLHAAERTGRPPAKLLIQPHKADRGYTIANFSRGYADEAIVPIADQEIRVLDDLIHNARWNVSIREDATEERTVEDPEARILRMQAAITSERDSFKEGTEWLNNLSEPKIFLSDTRDILGIKQDAKFPRVGSLTSDITLKSYQLQESAWIIRMLLPSACGAIVADEMVPSHFRNCEAGGTEAGRAVPLDG